MIRDLQDLAREVLEIHSEKDVSQIWRDDHVKRVVADYREYQLELNDMKLDDECESCKL
jgi:hypothetical protein